MVMLPLNPEDSLRRERLQADIDAAYPKRPIHCRATVERAARLARQKARDARRLALWPELVAALKAIIDGIDAGQENLGFGRETQARDVLKRAKEIDDVC